MQKYLCPSDIMEILQLSRSTVYKLLRQKQIPAVQIGHQYRISREELDKWMESNIDCKIEIEE